MTALWRAGSTARFQILSTVLLLVMAVPLLRAEDLSADQEAAIMAQEDELEAQLPLDKKPPGSLVGRIQLKSDAADEGEVVGFIAVQSRAYLLRLAKPEVLPQLRRFNGKTVTVFGRIRMRGKYFIAEGVQASTPGVERIDRGRRAGM